MSNGFNLSPQAAAITVHLLKGVLYQEQQRELWNDLLTFQAAIRDYFSVIGLDLYIDEPEGYAFLKQRSTDDEQDPDAPILPRLIQRRPLSYSVSLLLILLRRKLVETDAGGGETRVILDRQQIIEMVLVFMPTKGSEAKTVEQVDSAIRKVVEYGFLRKLKNNEDQYEVRRILKALVDADWLENIDNKLNEYREHADPSA